MDVLLVSIGAGILAYVAFVFLFPKAIPEEQSKHTKNVLKQIYEDTQTVANEDKKKQGILKEEFSEETPLIKLFYSLPGMRPLYVVMVQSGNKKLLAPMIGIMGTMAVIFPIFLYQAGGMGPASLPIGMFGAWYVPYFYFKRKIKKRNEEFVNTFPDVLDMIVRSVRSGFPINTAFKMVAENMEPPASVEFEQVVQEISLGRTVTESLNRMAERINEPDINFFVVVLSVQQETGGNLAEVISNLSNIIRKRKQLRLKIKAMTSEGRATAMILGSLPFFIFFILYFLRRDYIEPLWTDPTGQAILGTALGLVFLCMWIVKQMINIDI